MKYLAILIILLIPLSALADVYKYRDKNGHVHLTDRPMKGMTLLKRFRFKSTASRAKPGATWAGLRKRQKQLHPVITKVAQETRIRAELIHAVVRAESAYITDAVSKKGATGLMQLMPGTARRYGVGDMYDPYQNLKGGALYLRDLLVMFDQNLKLALAAYNAGENAVIKYGRQIPPYPETQNYVRKVMGFYRSQS